MSKVEVRAVVSRRERRQFLEFPWHLYRNDPFWVPPLRMNQRELVGYKRHPFYLQAESCTFLAWRDGQVCGRVAAIDNHAHHQAYPQDRRGFLGFFECVDDQQVANALFDAGRSWFQARDIVNLRGPVNPSMNYECGLLIEPFDMMPSFMMTYNPPYYARLWEAYGFEKAQDLISFIGHRSDLATLEKKVFFVVQEATRRFNLTMRPVSRTNFLQDVRTFLDIYNRSLEGNWGHVPMSDAEMRHVSKALRFLIEPSLTMMAEVDGKAIGAIFGLLNYNPRIKKIDGRLLPLGFLQLLRRRREIHRFRLVSTNVLPEYQKWGIGVVLAAHIVPPAMDFGIQEGEFSWVLESNHLSRKSLERGNLRREKLHRIYDFHPGGGEAA